MASGDSSTDAETHSLSPNFFSTLRVAVLRGREFSEQDRAGTPLVAMVSDALARRIWPGGDAVGRDLFIHGRAFRVVGVVTLRDLNNIEVLLDRLAGRTLGPLNGAASARTLIGGQSSALPYPASVRRP